MWKRERPVTVDLEHVLAQAGPLPVPAATPAPPAAATGQASAEIPAPHPAPTVANHAHALRAAAQGSTLGATLRFNGDLVADEDLVVQGQVEGSILHTRSLTIGAQGRMAGDIRARRIVVEGAVTGNLYALEAVTLRAGARVTGDVFAPRVAIDEGATLHGHVDMDNAPAVPTVRVPVPAEPAGGTLSDSDAERLLTGS